MAKIICSTSLHTKLPLKETLDSIHAMGFQVIDLLAFENWAHVQPSEIREDPDGMARHVGEALSSRGLSCMALNGLPLHKIFTRDDQKHRDNIRTIQGLSKFGGRLGAKFLSVVNGQPDPGYSDENNIKHVAARLQDLVDACRQEGMLLVLETHAGQLQSRPEPAMQMLSLCPGLKFAYDPSHFIMEETLLESTLCLLEHTGYVHLRNARVGRYQATMQDGLLDMPWMIDQIIQSSYDGPVAIEYLDGPAIEEGYDAVEQTKIVRELLLQKGYEL